MTFREQWLQDGCTDFFFEGKRGRTRAQITYSISARNSERMHIFPDKAGYSAGGTLFKLSDNPALHDEAQCVSAVRALNVAVVVAATGKSLVVVGQ